MPVTVDKTQLLLRRITEERIKNPERIGDLLKQRQPIHPLTTTGKLCIIAADHPARGVSKAGADPYAMAARGDYLQRIADILEADAADGVMATSDVIDELILLNEFQKEVDGAEFLAGKLLIGSLNRGGLAGSKWELNDPITSATPESCKNSNLDAAKLLLRIKHDDADSLKTIEYSVQAINQCVALKLPIFLEPLPVIRTVDRLEVVKEANALQQIVGIASALGVSSAYTWLKLPYVDNFQLVAQATTLPIVLLGGESGSEANFMNQMKLGLESGHNVCGVMVGRNVLYPEKSNYRDVAARVYELVHQK